MANGVGITNSRTAPSDASDKAFVSVVLPCLNEEAGLGPSIQDAFRGLDLAGRRGEVIVADNGSTDGSVEIARAAGARVVFEAQRGTGAATMAGIEAAKGDVIVTSDCDGTYDLDSLGDLLFELDAGADIVVANRLSGAPDREAMPWLHRHLGTPTFNVMLRLISGIKVADSQSGFRAFRKETVTGLGVKTPGFESVTEVLLRASRAGLTVKEVPSNYRPRLGESKLSTFGDGWRHLRMLLVFSPHFTLMLPGVLLLLAGLGLCTMPAFYPNGVDVFGLTWRPIFIGPLLVILGSHSLLLGALAAHRSELTPPKVRKRLSALDRPNVLDYLLTRLFLVALIGAGIDAVLFGLWASDLGGDRLLGLAGVAQAAIVTGIGGMAVVLASDIAESSLRGSHRDS